MKALVTGGDGFIGRHLIDRLALEEDVSVLRLTRRASNSFCPEETYCDLLCEEMVSKIMRRWKPDIIFHLAANPIIRESVTNPVAITHSNVVATHNLLAHCEIGTRFVFASSAAVYGNDASRGDWISENVPLRPNSVYGATKAASEALINAYHEQGKVDAISLRLVANVGYGVTHGVVRDIISKLRLNSEFLELLGDEPGSYKHYMHVDDTIEAMVHFGLNKTLSGVCNVANDDVLSVAALADVVMIASKMRKPVRWLGECANWASDNRRVQVSNEIARLHGWTPRYRRSYDAVYQAVTDMLEHERAA